MRKSELEQKLEENTYRISKLEKELSQLKEENDSLKMEIKNIVASVEAGTKARQELSDELYQHIQNQKNALVEYIDQYKEFCDKRHQNFSDEIYQHITNQNQMRDDRFLEFKNELWMRTFGFDNMVSELQLNAVEQMIPGNRKRLEALKNTHVGEKCFVIGNGPSLKAEDLDKLKEKGIFCFASKGIYNIFDETEWRPDVWAASDLKYTELKQDDLNNLEGFPKLVCAQSILKTGIQIKDAIYYPFIQAERTPRFFNHDITRGVHFYGTVTGKLINFAVYMGFEEIYLLGCDNTSPVVENEQGQKVLDLSKKNHFSDKYFGNSAETLKAYEDVGDIMKAWKYIDKSFEDIKYFCDKEQIKIFNSTRGGALEVYPRVEFEKALEKFV